MAGRSGQRSGGAYHEGVAACKKEIVEQALRRHAGNMSAAARDLGISHRAIRYVIRSLGIQVVRT